MPQKGDIDQKTAGKSGRQGRSPPQLVSIMFIMWEVRSAPKGKREVGVDENVWLTVVVSFTGCPCHLRHPW